MGGTAGLAEMIGEALRRYGVPARVRPARSVRSLAGYDAVIVGSALYHGRWHRDARRFVTRHRQELLTLPVWLFSSGPLGGNWQRPDVPPVRQVRRLMHGIGARGHKTFGGRLLPDASGTFRVAPEPWVGDWRDPDQVECWVGCIAAELETMSAAAADPTRAPTSSTT
jgi:menaquinone-dependent protoporphyrinogen oxidase